LGQPNNNQSNFFLPQEIKQTIKNSRHRGNETGPKKKNNKNSIAKQRPTESSQPLCVVRVWMINHNKIDNKGTI